MTSWREPGILRVTCLAILWGLRFTAQIPTAVHCYNCTEVFRLYTKEYSGPCTNVVEDPCSITSSFALLFLSWMFTQCFFHRYREDDHVGEVRRAAVTPALPICGLQQICGSWSPAPLPQQCGLQDCSFVGVLWCWLEVRPHILSQEFSTFSCGIFSVLFIIIVWTRAEVLVKGPVSETLWSSMGMWA